jgi:Ca2+/Na+ antiporter
MMKLAQKLFKLSLVNTAMQQFATYTLLMVGVILSTLKGEMKMTDFILAIIFAIIAAIVLFKNENKIETWLREVTRR